MKNKIKRINNRKIRLPISIKFFKNGQMVFSSTFTKKTSVARRTQAIPWDKAYIKVIYSNNSYNDGIYYNLYNLKNVLAAFTEKDLLDYLEE